MGALPPSELAASPAPFADAARAMWGDWAYPLVIIGAAGRRFGLTVYGDPFLRLPD